MALKMYIYIFKYVNCFKHPRLHESLVKICNTFPHHSSFPTLSSNLKSQISFRMVSRQGEISTESLPFHPSDSSFENTSQKRLRRSIQSRNQERRKKKEMEGGKEEVLRVKTKGSRFENHLLIHKNDIWFPQSIMRDVYLFDSSPFAFIPSKSSIHPIDIQPRTSC